MEVEKTPKLIGDEGQEKVIKTLEERLENHNENRKVVQNKLRESRNNFVTQIDELEERVSKELEEKFTPEDNRLQAALNELRGNRRPSALQKAKAELLVEQSYEVLEDKEAKRDLTTLCELKAEKRIVPELIEMRKPTNVRVAGVNRRRVFVKFTCLDPNEERVFSDHAIVNPIRFKCLLFKKGNEQESKEYPLDKNEGNNFFTFTPDTLEVETTYEIRVKMVFGDRESEWSDEIAEFTPGFKECCTWKECPGHAGGDSRKYRVHGRDPRVAKKVNDNSYCTVIGNTYIPLNKVTSWNIKMLKSRYNNGHYTYIGIAPSDINQNAIIYDKCGWYFYCYYSTLWSGPPHSYRGKPYGPRKVIGQYVRAGDSVGVVMDTTKGELSFAVNNVNHGVAYEGIPLDKPLVPCVLLYHKNDSVELDVSEVKGNVDGSIPIPSKIKTKKSKNACCSDKFAEERERIIKLLEERLAKHDDNRKAAQDKLHEFCGRLRAQIDELENRVSKELEEKFTPEDDRLQAALSEFRGNRMPSALQKAKAELLVEQSYEVLESKEIKRDLTAQYELKTEKRIIPELIETRKPTNVHVAGVNRGCVFVKFICFNPDEERVLSDHTIVNPVRFKCLLFKKGNEQEGKKYPLDKDEDNSSFLFTPNILETETTYKTKIKIILGDSEYEWSDEVAEFTTPEFKDCCVWKRCPEDVDKWLKYSVDGENPRVATKNNSYGDYCTIIGNTLIPSNAVTSWNIKILESKDNDGDDIFIGVAPSDINQYINDNFYSCGWYFDCYDSKLRSGPPHKYRYKEYGPRKGNGQYVHTGGSVGVTMDTKKGELSFAVNNVNLGVAYEGIPLDKPLVPCAILCNKGDSVEIII